MYEQDQTIAKATLNAEDVLKASREKQEQRAAHWGQKPACSDILIETLKRMKLRHALSQAIYIDQKNGTVPNWPSFTWPQL